MVFYSNVLVISETNLSDASLIIVIKQHLFLICTFSGYPVSHKIKVIIYKVLYFYIETVCKKDNS